MVAETNTRIKTGRLMNPKIVEDLLSVIPHADLERVKTELLKVDAMPLEIVRSAQARGRVND